MHLIQMADWPLRRVAVVREPELVLLRDVESVFSLAKRALSEGRRLSDLAEDLLSNEVLNYDAIYGGKSHWKLLSPIDVPGEPHRGRPPAGEGGAGPPAPPLGAGAHSVV